MRLFSMTAHLRSCAARCVLGTSIILAGCAAPPADPLDDASLQAGSETEGASGSNEGAEASEAPGSAIAATGDEARFGALDAAASEVDEAALEADEAAVPVGQTLAATGALDLTNVKDKSWTYFTIAGATCRDGSPAGFSLNRNSASNKFVLYLDGGGACFNAATCSQNPSKVSRKSASAGIFDRTNAKNPVADWNQIFVPYCTGDVHIGANPNGSVPGVGKQKFVGYTNVGAFLKTIAATFPSASQVLLTGTSAGGFGATGNFKQTAKAFPKARVNLVDDSGQPMRAPALAQCLQAQWRSAWGLDNSVIASCGADCKGTPDFVLAMSKNNAKSYPGFAQGLVSATQDTTIRQFFGFGASSCTAYAAVSGQVFKSGLLDVRTQHASLSNFGLYAYESSNHTLLNKTTYYSTSLGSAKSPAAWVGDIVDKNVVTQVGP